MPHFAFTGSVGFDMYEIVDGEYIYAKTFTPPIDISESYESVHDFKDKRERELVINFPLYSQVKELYIGVSNEAKISAPAPYNELKPFVYYGSSITQGGCASRPGNSYESIISRRFNADYLNLGFSGNAKGEEKMAEYISRLDMSVFVYDYDYNAPTEEHLLKTHERMFSIIRENNPSLPIIIMPSPHYVTPESEIVRHEIVKKTYENAIAKGDKNVYYISGEELMAEAGCNGTVDDCHPNDYGFYSMAKAIGDCIEKILSKKS
jgi:lysophospholipase L1-like esterase